MSIDALRTHYGFTRMPFGKNIAPGMVHHHHTHDQAVARISWAISETAIGVITGEVGAGKTVAIRTATGNLDPSRHRIIYLPNPAVGTRGLYTAIVTALGGTPRFHKSALIPQATDALAIETNERNKTVTIIFDEAHLLQPEQLDEIRMLTSADMDATSPFACLLVGQPTLKLRMKLGAFAALDQRISLRCELTGMTPDETGSYIAHHTALAGRTDTLFSADAIALIHQTSRGLPRAVNNLAVQALLAAYAANTGIVDESSARQAVKETAHN